MAVLNDDKSCGHPLSREERCLQTYAFKGVHSRYFGGDRLVNMSWPSLETSPGTCSSWSSPTETVNNRGRRVHSIAQAPLGVCGFILLTVRRFPRQTGASGTQVVALIDSLSSACLMHRRSQGFDCSILRTSLRRWVCQYANTLGADGVRGRS